MAMASNSKQKKRRVFLVDDHPLVREWLGNLINQQVDLEVCGEAANRVQALELIPALQPEIAIVDISLEGSSGLVLIKELKGVLPKMAVVVLSMYEELLYAERAFHSGARAYVMKREATKTVLEAIRKVLAGELYVSDDIARRISTKVLSGKPVEQLVSIDNLSNRELEVFELLGRGLTTRQVAERLSLSFKTVQSFLARIKQKLNLANATELLREATRWHDNNQSN